MTDQQVATREPVREARDVVSYAGVGMLPSDGGASMSPKTLGDVVAFATLMSRSQHAVPKHLRDNAGACLAVTMQALRWQMDPFAVAAKTYNVKDQVAYEAQVVSAAINTLAPLKSRPRIEFDGVGDKRTCTVTGEFKDGSTHSYTSPPIVQIPTKNSPLWKGDPDQQLGYYSVRSFARRHCPEVILGVYTPDELEHAPSIRDVTPKPAGIMARLAAGGAPDGPGFSAGHVEAETNRPLPPEAVDAVIEDAVEAEFTPDPYDDDDTFPGGRPAPGAEPIDDADDPETWGREEMARIAACDDLVDLDNLEKSPDLQARFSRLEAHSPSIAKELAAMARGKRKALTAKANAQ